MVACKGERRDAAGVTVKSSKGILRLHDMIAGHDFTTPLYNGTIME